MSNSRPPIPDKVKAEVRIRCGFGCVVCGHPIYEYHHMLEWAKVKRHVAEEITLLCDSHHRLVPNMLTNDQVARFDKNPYNKKNKISRAFPLFFEGDDAIIELGGLQFTISKKPRSNPGTIFLIPLAIQGEFVTFFQINRGGELLFNLKLYDSHNNLTLWVDDNELRFNSGAIDIMWKKNILKFLGEPGYFEIEFLPPNLVKINEARFQFNGNVVEITDRIIMFNEQKNGIRGGNYSQEIGNNFVEIAVGIAVGEPYPPSPMFAC